MASSHARVTVTTTATRLDTPAAAPDYVSPGQRVRVQNPTGATQSVFLGGAGVTAAAYGHELAAGTTVEFDLARDDELWGIVAATTQVVNVLRTRV